MRGHGRAEPAGGAPRLRRPLTRVRVWLLRHGASTTPAGVTIGAGDPPLSDAGRAEAERLTRSLAARPLVAVWSSDLRRAAATAAIVAAPHGLAVATTRALRELDFGAWEGRALGELWHEDPDAAGAWEADITATPGTFGESVADLVKRVAEFWHRVELSGETVVVAHRGSLAALQALITEEPFASAFRFPSAWVEARATHHRPGRSASRSPRRREA